MKHHKSGFNNCKICAELLAVDEQNLNVYWCGKCLRASVSTKPTKYHNCPCGSNLEILSPNTSETGIKE